MPDDTRLLEAVLQRLNILIALQLDAAPKTASGSMSDRIRKLNDLGLGPGEIGSILGKKANYVSAVIGNKRKRTNE